MKADKIVVMALAGLILAVMTIDTASAWQTTWTYGMYALGTTYSGGASPSLDSNQPSGNYNVNYNDIVQWENILRNYDSHGVNCKIAHIHDAQDSDGLYDNEPTVYVSAGSISPMTTYSAIVTVDSAHTITAFHSYYDSGTTYTSPACTSMQFY